MMMQRLTIRASPVLIERARRRARDRGVSLSRFVRDALRRYLDGVEERTTR
jgi:predicted HicB family RNase H-like nuclease